MLVTVAATIRNDTKAGSSEAAKGRSLTRPANRARLPEIPSNSVPGTGAFKTKIELAQELVDDTLQREGEIQGVLFDNRFASKGGIKFVRAGGLHWVARLKSDRNKNFVASATVPEKRGSQPHSRKLNESLY